MKIIKDIKGEVFETENYIAKKESSKWVMYGKYGNKTFFMASSQYLTALIVKIRELEARFAGEIK